MNTVYSLFRNANVISVTVFSKLSETFNPFFAAFRSKEGQSDFAAYGCEIVRRAESVFAAFGSKGETERRAKSDFEPL